MMSRALFAAFGAVLACLAIGQKPATPAPAPQPAIPASAKAMMPPPMPGDTFHIHTKVGTFKMLRKSPESPPAGRLEISFAGTVLVYGLEPGSFIQVTGNVRKEYDRPEHQRQVYFGRGKILLVGKFQTCQWFGQDLDFTFTGSAVVRMVGEFDKNLETGYFWYDPTRKEPMQTQLLERYVPEPTLGPTKAITREEFEKKKKSGG
jgi:hypothetical protein